jgi:UDP-GlcNAc:undecaprenyl-phosphate GlcNAc-1-phosphate transferase
MEIESSHQSFTRYSHLLTFYQIIELVFVFFFSITTLFFLRKVAFKVGLVDTPSSRKKHQGSVPLVGGIAICCSLIYFIFNNPELFKHSFLYVGCIVTLVFVGALDDKYDISYKIRFAVQAILSIAMMYMGNIELNTLGNLLGGGEILLGWLGYVITIVAVIACINAFNMVDGIDGLLGALSIVTFGGLALLMGYYGLDNLAYMCIALITMILPYIMLNLGLFSKRRKVFMGDAGSMLIGFTVIWLLLVSSQEDVALMRPVTALWLIAIPLMDMAAIMIRRIRRGCSPFKPDREHLHHIFQRLGLSSNQTLFAISILASVLAGFGILGEVYSIPEYVMFFTFLITFIAYLYILTHIWTITSKIRRKP